MKVCIFILPCVASGHLFCSLCWGRVFSYLDVPSLCRCARVSKYWNQIALDGSNWQHVDLFSFQTDIEVRSSHSSNYLLLLMSMIIFNG